MTKQRNFHEQRSYTHTLLYVYIWLCNDVYDGELPMTPHEWEDNRPPQKPRLTNMDYLVILGVSFSVSTSFMVGDWLTLFIASWAWSAYERARVKQR